jgi:uroporphyrinogen-III synthase
MGRFATGPEMVRRRRSDAAPDKRLRGPIFDRRAFGKGGSVGIVLITRPEPGATETAARVAALGHSPVIAPVLEIETLRGGLGGLNRIAATILTSRNAVAACPVLCHGRPAFAVGDATAARARALDFTDVRSASGDAAALAVLVADALPRQTGPLFLPAGHRQAQDLARDLRERGFRVIRRVAYRAKPALVLPDVARLQLNNGNITVMLFFSAETARHFVRLVRAAGLVDSVESIEAVSISDRATMPLRGLPWRRISVAAQPNQDAMLALLQ